MTSRDPEILTAFDLLLEDLGSEESRRGYRNDWANFRSWCASANLDVLAVNARDMQRWMRNMVEEGKARRTRGRALSVVREVYRALVNAGLLAVNPARETKNAKQGKGDRRVTWLEEDDLARLLGWRGETWEDRRDRLCVQILAGTGKRRSEVARLRVSDFNEDGVTGVVKGGSEKTVPVPSWLRAAVADWCAYAGIESGAVLPRTPEDRRAVSGDMIYNILVRVSGEAQISRKISPHGIRRTLATLAKRRGTSISDLQTQLGHAAQGTTEQYLMGSRKVEQAPGEWMGELVK